MIIREFEHPARWPEPSLPQTTDLEKAYTAGLVDGEGTILLTKWGSSYLPLINVTNTDQRAVDWLRQRFGGKIYRSKRALPQHKTALRWTLTGKWAAAFIREILPYLVLKREQAMLLLEYYAPGAHFHWGNRALPTEELQRRRELHDAISALNRRGVIPDA